MGTYFIQRPCSAVWKKVFIGLYTTVPHGISFGINLKFNNKDIIPNLTIVRANL